jgi:ABC-2 type transport system permease protein
MREVRNMNREPVYFINGPMIVLLMPVIVAVMVLAQGQSLGELKAMLAGLGQGPWLMLVAAASGAFLGSSTSITCTSISRDAKVLSYIKSLPLPMGEFALAKFLHGFSFSAFGAAVGVTFIGAFAGLPAPGWAGALFMALAVSAFIDVLGLWLDTANPRLSWDNPTAAMKQNLNAVIVILGTMALLGGLGVLAAYLRLGVWENLLAFGLLPALLAAGGLALYPRYAIRRIASLET